jgi:hypothetical protein
MEQRLLRAFYQWLRTQPPRRRRWGIFLLAVALIYPIFRLGDMTYLSLFPYKRYQPLCYWDRGGRSDALHPLSGELTPAFYEAVRPNLSKADAIQESLDRKDHRAATGSDGGARYVGIGYHVVDGVIYVRRRLTDDQEEMVWNATTWTVMAILRERWNLFPLVDIEARLKAEGYSTGGPLTCEAVRKIAIQPSS